MEPHDSDLSVSKLSGENGTLHITSANITPHIPSSTLLASCNLPKSQALASSRGRNEDKAALPSLTPNSHFNRPFSSVSHPSASPQIIAQPNAVVVSSHQTKSLPDWQTNIPSSHKPHQQRPLNWVDTEGVYHVWRVACCAKEISALKIILGPAATAQLPVDGAAASFSSRCINGAARFLAQRPSSEQEHASNQPECGAPEAQHRTVGRSNIKLSTVLQYVDRRQDGMRRQPVPVDTVEQRSEAEDLPAGA